MESTGARPDPDQARAALAGIHQAQRAVRDTPWPTWLYPANALLLGAMALTPLLEQHRTRAFLLVALVVVGVNLVAGYRMGTPWALPTSRLFLGAVTAAGACVLAALLLGDVTARSWPVPVLAIAAAGLYLAGAVAHRRSTGPAPRSSRRPR
ncbi:hypothetical protein GTQ99_08350 [Kineococcus sp. T13]|uniref:hypothetical protein n=1 Tax=Kineococcus vitellinus TaxID=2696565 RepID=UPI00141286C4|nr:hypothetical protein [Kineococcus vitellinus]NAZ75431.1 hypothetical protein [Kineococcus vitellinus]